MGLACRPVVRTMEIIDKSIFKNIVGDTYNPEMKNRCRCKQRRYMFARCGEKKEPRSIHTFVVTCSHTARRCKAAVVGCGWEVLLCHRSFDCSQMRETSKRWTYVYSHQKKHMVVVPDLLDDEAVDSDSIRAVFGVHGRLQEMNAVPDCRYENCVAQGCLR